MFFKVGLHTHEALTRDVIENVTFIVKEATVGLVILWFYSHM